MDDIHPAFNPIRKRRGRNRERCATNIAPLSCAASSLSNWPRITRIGAHESPSSRPPNDLTLEGDRHIRREFIAEPGQ
jgi:hypothetical protein